MRAHELVLLALRVHGRLLDGAHGEVALRVGQQRDGAQLLVEALDAIERRVDVLQLLADHGELALELQVLFAQRRVLVRLARPPRSSERSAAARSRAATSTTAQPWKSQRLLQGGSASPPRDDRGRG